MKTTEDIVEFIRKHPSSPLSVFLEFELHDRYEKRPIEEKHLSYDGWRKMLSLRDENQQALIDKSFSEFLVFSKTKPAIQPKKNKDYFKDKNIIVPDAIKNLSTKALLKLRYSHSYDDVLNNKDAIYAELANRPHFPSKEEKKKQKLLKNKKNGRS